MMFKIQRTHTTVGMLAGMSASAATSIAAATDNFLYGITAGVLTIVLVLSLIKTRPRWFAALKKTENLM